MVIDDNPRPQNDAEEINPCNPQFPSMVIIKHSSLPSNKDLSIFPPVNHENLHLFSPPPSTSSSLSSSSSSASSSFSPSDSDQSDPDSPLAAKRPAFGASSWWLGIGLEALRLRALRSGGNGVVWWRGSWAYGLAAAAAAMAMVWSLWQRRRIRSLVSVVRDRDEKINKLLHQIAQLNEVLVARHKLLVSKVPN